MMTEVDKNTALKKLIDRSISREEYRALELAALDDPFLFDAIEGYVLSDGDHSQAVDNVNRKVNTSIKKRSKSSRLIYLVTGLAAACFLGIIYVQTLSNENKLNKNLVKTLANKKQRILESKDSNVVVYEQAPASINTDKTIKNSDKNFKFQDNKITNGFLLSNKDKEDTQEAIAVEDKLITKPEGDLKLNADQVANEAKDDKTYSAAPAPAIFSSGAEVNKKTKIAANQIAIRGKVLKSNGEPVIGANIITQYQAVTTKLDGTFAMVLPNEKNFAVIAQRGYETQGVHFANDDDVTIFLKQDDNVFAETLKREKEKESPNFTVFNTRIASKIDKYLREENIKVMGRITIYFQLDNEGKVYDFIFQNSFDYSLETSIKRWINDEKHLLPTFARGQIITVDFEP